MIVKIPSTSLVAFNVEGRIVGHAYHLSNGRWWASIVNLDGEQAARDVLTSNGAVQIIEEGAKKE